VIDDLLKLILGKVVANIVKIERLA